MVSSFGSYAYSENEDTFFIDLYAGGTVKTEKGITLTCETDFPHGGTAKYTIKGEAETTVAIRIPAWSEKSLLTVNGEAVDLNAVTKDGYAFITRAWKDGDTLALTMDMTPHVVYASAKIAADSGKVCVQRGALVYCAEEVDNGKVLPLYVKARNARRHCARRDRRLRTARHRHAVFHKGSEICGKDNPPYPVLHMGKPRRKPDACLAAGQIRNAFISS